MNDFPEGTITTKTVEVAPRSTPSLQSVALPGCAVVVQEDVSHATMPIERAERPLINKEVPDTTALRQMLEYREFEPSERERTLIDVLVKTKSFKQATWAVNQKFKRHYPVAAVKKWIQTRSHVRFYLAEKLKEAGIADISKDKWLSDMVQIATQDKKINSTTPMMYKLIGEARGFFPGEKGSQGIQISGSDLRINILQSDGRA